MRPKTNRKTSLRIRWLLMELMWCIMGRKAEPRCPLFVFFRQEAEDIFAHPQEVDDLGNAEERRNDQGATVGSFQEGWRTLIAHNFPREEISHYLQQSIGAGLKWASRDNNEDFTFALAVQTKWGHLMQSITPEYVSSVLARFRDCSLVFITEMQ